MGKAKKARSNSHKKKRPPTGLLSQEEVQQLAMDSTNTPKLLTGLSSSKGSTREATCVALASIFGSTGVANNEQKRRALNQFIDSGAIKKLIPCVIDSSEMIRLHALGVLRNMSVTGGIEFCEYMTTQDIMTPLTSILSEPLLSESSNVQFQIWEQCIALLVNLCESNEIAVKLLTQSHFFPNILQAFQVIPNQYNALKVEMSKLLLVVTDHNPTLCQWIESDPQRINMLVSLAQSTLSLNIRLNLGGALMNLPTQSTQKQVIQLVLTMLEQSLEYNPSNVLNMAQELSNLHTQLNETAKVVDIEYTEDNNAEAEVAIEKEKREKYDNAAQIWHDSVTNLNLGLELVANLLVCTEGDENEEEWDTDDEEGMEQAAHNMNNDTVKDTQNQDLLINAIISSQLVFKVHNILSSLISTPKNLSPFIIKDFNGIRTRLCTVLSNLFQVLPMKVLATLSSLWDNLFALYQCWLEHQEQDLTISSIASIDDFEASVTSALFAIVRRIEEENRPQDTIPITDAQIQLLIQRSTASKSIDTKVNIIEMFGVIGKRKKKEMKHFIEMIGSCFYACLSDSSMQVVSGAINAIFDIFGDDDLDFIYHKFQFQDKLQSVCHGLKDKIRVERKSIDPCLVAHYKETRLNLIRFIKYKQG